MEKYNFKVDSTNKSVTVTVSTAIYSNRVILHAAYHFIEEGKVIVEGEDKTVTITLIPDKDNSEANLEDLAYEFNIQLIASSIENTEGEKYANLREGLMRAAISQPRPSSRPPENGEK